MAMVKLSKEDEQKLMWIWHDDSALQLIYRTFEDFVFARTGYKKEADHANT